jgi:hypothetical protein
MSLTPQQTLAIKKTLIELYGKENIHSDTTGKKIIIYVEIPKGKEDRPFRINMLKEIDKGFKSLGSKYTQPPQGKSGAVKISGISIEVKKVIDPANTASSIKKSIFKPKHIVPQIVNDWLSPEDIVKNVQTYIKKLDLETNLEKNIIDLLNLTLKSSGSSIPFNVDKDLIPPEFFEILTSVKLGVLLRTNNTKIRFILGIPPKMDLSKSKIKIYLPESANYPLVDYYISISSMDKKSEDDSLKISVKSKVAGTLVNTVKFDSVFDTIKEVDDWYKSLNTSSKAKEKGPKIIAESAMMGYGYSGKNMAAVPLLSVNNLLKEDMNKVSSTIQKNFKNINVSILKKVLNVVASKLTTAKYKTPLTEFVGVSGLTRADIVNTYSMITDNIIMKGGKIPEDTVWNLAHLCEKILEVTTETTSQTSYNFYQLFFDEVLKKKSIAYAVAKREGKQLTYNFYSKVNYKKEYNDWIKLRTKNSANQPNDVIGLEA